MNLSASSICTSHFYIAVNSLIQVYNSIGTHASPISISPIQSLKINQEESTINAIKVGCIGQDEILIAVYDSGLVVIYYTTDLKRDPMIFDNRISTWGIAIQSQKKLVAVSSNAFIITIYNMNQTHAEPMYLKGHSHNIPSIDFSSCGRYLVSGSVDCSCIIWNLENGEPLHSFSIENKW